MIVSFNDSIAALRGSVFKLDITHPGAIFRVTLLWHDVSVSGAGLAWYAAYPDQFRLEPLFHVAYVMEYRKTLERL